MFSNSLKLDIGCGEDSKKEDIGVDLRKRGFGGYCSGCS